MRMHGIMTGAWVLAGGVSAQAQAVNYDGFADTAGLTLNGWAGVVETQDGHVLRLTPASGNSAGSVFSSVQVDARSFSTAFSFRITEPGGIVFDMNDEAGADGIVFVVQRISNSIGGIGQGIGYDGIGNSLGVEFDTWGNAANNDPSQSHVGIVTNGSVNHVRGGVPLPTANVTDPELDDGDRWWAWIDYDGTTLEVRLALDPARPAEPLLAEAIDLPGLLGQATAFVGFTSATGAAWANHDVIDWSYTCYTVRCPANWDETCGVDVNDLLAFLGDFRTGSADFDGDGATNVNDLLAFLGAFRIGC